MPLAELCVFYAFSGVKGELQKLLGGGTVVLESAHVTSLAYCM